MSPGRHRIIAAVFDAACVLALVVIGTRNHDTDTGLAGVLVVGAPFWIAALASRAIPLVHRGPRSVNAGLAVWVCTVAVGMTLRHVVFDRGTALAFVIVASVFLGLTMVGWRALAARTRRA